MKVKFDADFDYTPSGDHRIQIAYRAGWAGTVKRECGDAAIAAGKVTGTAQDLLDHDGDGRLGRSLPNATKTRVEA